MYEYKAMLTKLVDGDTMDLTIDVGFKMTTAQRVRLKGINTPETWRRKKTSDEYKKGMENSISYYSSFSGILFFTIRS